MSETSESLFDRAADLGKEIATLVGLSWAAGMRDGFTVAAAAMDTAVATTSDENMPPHIKATLSALSQMLRLRAFDVEMPQ